MKSKLLKSLGNIVKGARIEKGLTQQELAYSIGKDQQSINRLERGKINPSYIYLLEVCEGLEMSLSDLLDH